MQNFAGDHGDNFYSIWKKLEKGIALNGKIW